MSLEKLLQLNNRCPRCREVLGAIGDDARLVQVEGLAAAAKGWMLAGLFSGTGRTMLVVTYNQEQAERIAEDLPLYGIPEEQVLFYPASDALIYTDGKPDAGIIGERLSALHALASGKMAVVVAPVNAALRRTMPREMLAGAHVSAKVGQELDMDEFAEKLVNMGYDRTDVVDQHGEFSRRGGIIDVYPSNEDDPVRIELWGDEIESIRHFDSATQRSVDKIESVTILPTREVLITPENARKASAKIKKEMEAQLIKLREAGDTKTAEALQERVESDVIGIDNTAYIDPLESYLPYFHSEESSIFDYLPADAIVVLDEPMQVKSHWEHHEEEITKRLIDRADRYVLLATQQKQHVPFEHTIKRVLSHKQGVSFALLPRPTHWARPDVTVVMESSPMDPFGGHMEAAAEQLKVWRENGLVAVVATAQDKRMLEILEEFAIPAVRLNDVDKVEPGVYVSHAALQSGYKLNSASLMVMTDSEIFGATRMRRLRKASHEGVAISSVMDLREGDLVVHVNHGIGYYRGIHKLETNGVEREYLLLQYAGDDKLYVPTDQIDRVQRYIGGEGNTTTVHRIGGSEWQRTTAKVKKAVQEMAKELVELYAWRQALGGHSYAPDTPWQGEMESAFPFTETPDQLSAIKDVKRDLEDPKPMDRLICGDVGYGKTEVAIRAAFKVISEGRQVAVLTPTTVLAQQHFNTFSERLAAFPVEVAQMSRFLSKKEQGEVAEGLKFGTVDVVIGTHRLLSKDIEFKNLGLVIVDEEQRFGVRHKEKLKQLKKTVDVLTMTATPIPRTLHMSLAGIRDMSVINDPPEGRMPIKTFLREAEADIIRDAIVRELDRGGQLFFVHNRVENIGHVADQIQKLVPYARVDIGHGQMSESELERVMMDFYEHKFDILICTTIIESGLDIPNANTIIINEADKLGLAQLYQLRGRVGRSNKQAYAYLLYKPNKQLTEIAEKRLAAIHEFTDLGSGYRIAMRDLEIRGAGNLLGAQQSGQMAAVGFDLYCQLLSRAVAEMKGEEIEEIELPPVDLPVHAYIPHDYMPTDAHRILFYKKMAAVTDASDVKAVQDELEDRFGDPPKAVWNMLAVLRLRVRCRELGISSIGTFRKQVQVKFATGTRLAQDMCKELMRTHRRHLFEPDKLSINPSNPGRIISEVEDMVEVLSVAFREMKKRLARA